MVCHYLFFNHGFEFQDSVCIVVLILAIAIITIKNVDYRCIFRNMKHKPEAIDSLKSSPLNIVGTYKIILS